MLDEQHHLPRLVADIGGTNARFAMFFDNAGTLSNERSMSCDPYAGPVDAIEAYLTETNAPRPHEIAMAVATTIGADRIQFTNNHWAFSVEETLRALGVAKSNAVPQKTDVAMVHIARGLAWSWVASVAGLAVR